MTTSCRRFERKFAAKAVYCHLSEQTNPRHPSFSRYSIALSRKGRNKSPRHSSDGRNRSYLFLILVGILDHRTYGGFPTTWLNRLFPPQSRKSAVLIHCLASAEETGLSIPRDSSTARIRARASRAAPAWISKAKMRSPSRHALDGL